ncbi:MAG: histidine kinase [Saprospiraceae bacterium]|nr:histidine kinase [Saprospiraceae bacterium]
MARLFTLLFLFLSAVALHAQPPNFMVYSLAQGLPQSQVFATLQDSRGYLWMGTQGGGLCRFDGLDFQTLTTEHGLPSNYINALWEDDQQRLWVGTNAGICFFQGKSFEKIPAVESRGVQALCFGKGTDGHVWAGTDKGVFACDAASKTMKKINLPPIPEKAAVWAFLSTPSGLWIATDAGAFRLGGQGIISLNTKNGLNSNAARSFTISEGKLWIASAGGGIVVVDEPSGKVIDRYANPAWPTTLLTDRNGKVWVGTSDNGLSIFNPTDPSWTQVTEKQGFPHHYVRTIVSDNAGNIWVGTSGGGVVKFLESQPFTHFGAMQGLAGNRVYALQQDNQNRLILAVSQVGLQVLDSTGITTFARDSGLLDGVKTKTVAEDQFGRIWVGTEGRGLVVFDTSAMFKVQGLSASSIQKVIPGAAGEMWVAGINGISRVLYNASGVTSVKNYGQSEGLKGLSISTLLMDKQGGLWFADQLGNVGLIQNGRIERVFGIEHGLPGTPIRCFAIQNNGRLWAGTKGAGIFEADASVDPLRFVPLKTPKKLASENIYLLLFDALGNLWAGSESGVEKLALENGKVTDNQHFGRNEGFLGIETCQDAAFCDKQGNLWFGTMNGLMKYTPSSRKSAGTAPLLHFESVTLYYKPIEASSYGKFANPQGGLFDGLSLPWNENHLSFEFRAVDLAHPDAIRYRWRLDGAPNAQWSPLTIQTAVNFAGLQPGDYTFRAEATSDGIHFSEPIVAPFSIRKPFWQHLGFQLGIALLLFGLAVLITRQRIKRVKQAESEKRAKLEMQNHLLQLEQKALQLQMNPHFIFNTLNSIQSLVSTGDGTEARAQIGHFAQLMRGILNNSRKPIISLKDEAETLDQYLKLEQFCHQHKFDYRIELPKEIDPEELEIPPMLFQPFVENAVIHGVSHLNRQGYIQIAFEVSESLLICCIRDNGIGREAAARLRRERKPGHQSVALSVTRERLEALRGGAEFAPLQITDIHDEAGEIAGTQVVVKIIVRQNY